MRRSLALVASYAKHGIGGSYEAVAAGQAIGQNGASCSAAAACLCSYRPISMSSALHAGRAASPSDPADEWMTDAELKSALRKMNKGAFVTDRQLQHFKEACGSDVSGSLEVSIDRLEAIAAASEDPEFPVSIGKLLSKDSKSALAEQMLRRILSSVREETKKLVMATMASANRQDFLLFMCRHLGQLSQGNPDTMMQQLLMVYDLHSKKVSRSFEPGYGGAMHPAVAWSAMKPLHVEMSHRTGTLIYLFEPQRITLGSFIDFSKVIRPLRAKNYVKRTKFKNFNDVYYSE